MFAKRETMVKVTLSEKSSPVKEWEQSCHTDLPALLQAVKLVKFSVNDYLTDLIRQHEDFVSSDQLELTEHADLEGEITDDDVSGFIKLVNSINAKSARHEKRKLNYMKQAKKIRK